MTKYRKKPVEIEAVRWSGSNMAEMMAFISEEFSVQDSFLSDEGASLFIPTLEGEMQARPGDWIIKGVKGEFYPCKSDIFDATYDPC